VRRSTGVKFSGNEYWTNIPYYGTRGTFFEDVTGDGKADAIVVNDGGVTVRRSTGYGFSGNEYWTGVPYYGDRGTFFADVTGDGKADAIVVNEEGVTVRRSTGIGFSANEAWTSERFYGDKGTFFADVTGDGRADAIAVNSNDGYDITGRVTVRRSTGSGFGGYEYWTAVPFFGERGTFFADVSGDGKADAIVVNYSGVTVRRSTGYSFTGNEAWTSGSYYGSRGSFFADVTGDAKADAIIVNSAVSNSDSDGDGLLDVWEYYGMDVNADGIIDLDLRGLGASMWHKDVFVEVDAMVDRAPTTATLNRVVTAFADAPIGNRDGVNGIALHLQRDEMALPLIDFPHAPDAWPSAFVATKATRFGTPAERASGNWANIRTAKLDAFRYCIFGNSHGGDSSSGYAETPGNDFMVTLGLWTVVGGTSDQQAGTFMHELGHTLNLYHGGGDSLNFKPNYHSVMNYLWSTPNLWYTNVKSSWVLDYSHGTFPPLDESALDESTGIGGHIGHYVKVKGILSPVYEGPAAFSLVGVDWNEDGDYFDSNISRDLNANGTFDTLRDHNDWGHLRYALDGFSSFNSGPTYETLADLSDILFYRNPLGDGPTSLTLRRSGEYIELVDDETAIAVARREVERTRAFQLLGLELESDTLTIDASTELPDMPIEVNGGLSPATPPTLSLDAEASLNEGDVLEIIGSFADSDDDEWTATVAYGDGTEIQSLALNADKTFALNHVYADNGTYVVTVRVNDSQGCSTLDDLVVTVHNLSPSLDAGVNQAVSEGSTVLALSTFNDSGSLDTHTATINWGDGTATEYGVVNESPAGPPGSTFGLDGSVLGTHAYADNGTYTVTVTVTDDDGESGSTAHEITSPFLVSILPTSCLYTLSG
jgi:hypothetical protein